MSTLCLTGWQQPADALSAIAPDDAEHFDYSAYNNADAMFKALPPTPQLAIGWSLGGQLLMRAISGGHVKPKMLILLAVPYQWVASSKFPGGFPKATVNEVRKKYRNDPVLMLKSLNALIALGDLRERQITRTLNDGLAIWPNGAFWLEELISGSCDPLDFSAFPPALIIHGLNDKVIRIANAQAISARMPQAESLLWPRCAHAPHLHDAEALLDIVSEYV